MENQTYTVGERVDKLCAVCNEERGHLIASVSKSGRISRVSCPKCSTRSTFKSSTKVTRQSSSKSSAPYDQTCTYRNGQDMIHPIFGPGEVMALIHPQKIDVLFSDRMRRLIHARAQ